MEIDNDSDEPNLCNYEKLEGNINGVEKWISLDKIESPRPEPKKVSFQFFFVCSKRNEAEGRAESRELD